MDKNKLREKYLELRNKLSKQEVSQKSNEIINKLLNSDMFKSSKSICIYVSKENEVNTQELIKELLNSKEKKVIVPKVINEELTLIQITSFDELKEGYYSVLEPCIIDSRNKVSIKNLPVVYHNIPFRSE